VDEALVGGPLDVVGDVEESTFCIGGIIGGEVLFFPEDVEDLMGLPWEETEGPAWL